MRPCSPKLATLFDAAKSRCGTPDQNDKNPDAKPSELDKMAQKQLAKTQEAICKSVGIMVRLYVAMRMFCRDIVKLI